jgi:Sec-independent protein secretion pathway component TatC
MKNNLLFPLFCFFLLVFLTKNQKESTNNSFAVAKGIIQMQSQSVVQDTLTPHEFQYELAKQKSRSGLLTAGAVFSYIVAVLMFFQASLLRGVPVISTRVSFDLSFHYTKALGVTLLALLIFIIAILLTIKVSKSNEIRKKMEEERNE